jgi:putative ubiquitin-RnfH superfamily antitoxin RatB of RatAB toxin-antitoxin module
MLQLTIAWTCVGVFIATAVITLLALVKVIELASPKYLSRLFKVLIVEVVTACVGVFTGQVELPSTVEARVEDRGHDNAVQQIAPKVEELNKAIEAKEAKIAHYLQQIPHDAVKPEDRAMLVAPLRLDPKLLRSRVNR